MTTKIQLTWYQWLVHLLFDRIPYRLDSWVRRLDRWLFRTDNEERTLRKLLQPPGHSIVLPLLYLALTYFVIVGPTYDMLADNFFLPFTIWLVSLLVVAFLGRRWPRRIYEAQLLGLAFVIAAVFLAIALFGGSTKESDNTLYTHIYLAIAPLTMLIPTLSRWGLRWLFKSLDAKQLQNKFAERFATIELFEDRGEKISSDELGITWDRFGNAFMLALFYNPVLLLLLPSIWVLLTQERHDLALHFWLGVALSFLLLLYGRLRQRWHIMMELVERATTVGVPLIISLVVIGLALGRLVDFSYVSIFLDGTRLTIWGYLFAFYTFAWLLEYWINRFLNEWFLSFFSPDVKRGDFQFSYRFTGKNVLPASEEQLKRERVFQIHGGSRFLVQSRDKQWFHSYNRLALLERLLQITGNQQDYIANRRLLNTFARKIRIYFFTQNLVLILVAWGFIASQSGSEVTPLYSGKPLSTAPASDDCDSNPANQHAFRLDCALGSFVADHRNGENDESAAILFAASGGGTRAALHTVSVLYGLRQQNLADNILLMSGVSGGGVASAYFTHHYPALTGSSSDAQCPPIGGGLAYDVDKFVSQDAWRCYFEAMSHHYIKDVVEGMGEWRILGQESNGRLLEESLQDHFTLAENNGVATQAAFQQVKSHGLILNSTITGHRFQESEELSQLFRQAQIDPAQRYYFTIFQGGRLALSNLHNAADLHFNSYAPSPDLALKYRGFNFPAMPLWTAAAMTANFPPVFSDARLCTAEDCDGDFDDRSMDYFVTDGGATHNQGLISLFSAAQSAVAQLPNCTDGRRQALPRLHVVVAEASFANFDYSEGGRGLGAALSASYGLGHGVVGQQFADLLAAYNEKYQRCNQLPQLTQPSIEVHVLSLPRLFRSRGGMGTHWMMPTNIKVAKPNVIDPERAPRIKLTRNQLKHYFVNAYGDHLDICQAENVADNDFAQLCDALRLDGSMPQGGDANPICTPWLRFNRAVKPGSPCRELSELE